MIGPANSFATVYRRLNPKHIIQTIAQPRHSIHDQFT
jgi:hypothetical protein